MQLMTLRCRSLFLAIALLPLCLSVAPAHATAVIKFGLGGVSQPEFQFVGGVFSTRDDGNAATTGLQNTNIDFSGDLSALSDILAGASFSLEGVAAFGSAQQNGSVVMQSTQGGTFALYDDSNTLLLSGTIDQGVLAGSTQSSAGTFFNTNSAMFTGGSLLSMVASQPVGFSIALVDIFGQSVGMAVCHGELQDFTANGDGLLSAAAVPEPASAVLLLSGLLGLGVCRRRSGC